MNMTITQDQIKTWFDETYRRRKFSYLRPRKAYEIFATLLDVKPKKKHLDVACGLGLMMKTMASKQVQSFGIDISTEAIKQAREYCPEGKMQVGNAESLSFESEQFDYITCLGSLERMMDRKHALREQYRVAKKDAKICLMVRNSEHFTWRFIFKLFRLDYKKGHQDALNLQEWTDLFLSCGFKVKSVDPDHWPFYKFLSTVWPFGVDTSRRRRFFFPLTWAYEFIFILEKP